MAGPTSGKLEPPSGKLTPTLPTLPKEVMEVSILPVSLSIIDEALEVALSLFIGTSGAAVDEDAIISFKEHQVLQKFASL